jgi:hypothetical protein
MTGRTKLLALLALPAGAIGYVVSSAVIGGLDVPDVLGGALQLFLPLFVAALCMLPFVLPLFDAMAKRDLAELQAQRQGDTVASTAPDEGTDPT